MPDYNFKPSFPISSVVDAAQRKAQIEQQSQQMGNQQLAQGLQAVGQIGQSLFEQKQKVAQALALGKMLAGDTPPSTSAVGSIGGNQIIPAQTAEGAPNAAPMPNDGRPSPKAMSIANAVMGSDPKALLGHLFPQQVNVATIDPTTGEMVNQGTTQKGSIVKTLPLQRQLGTDKFSWDTATPQQQELGKALYEGRIRPSDVGFRDRGKIVMLANEYGQNAGLPAFKAYQGELNANMGKASTTGKIGQNATSLNTALGHASDALGSYEAIGNTNQAWLNKPINWLKENTNDPNVIALGINLNALQGELANTFKNSGATDQEIHSWSKYLNENLTPAQFYGALGKIDALLKSRLGALEYQRGSVAGGGTGSLISPHAQEISNKLSGSGSASNPDLMHLSTKELMDLRKKMTAHQGS